MEEQAHRMSRLVDDLLSLSRIELREHDAPSSQSDIVAILRSVAATLELAAARRGMRIEVVAAALPPVVGERDELTQVLPKLLATAVNTGEDNPGVRVTPAGLANN